MTYYEELTKIVAQIRGGLKTRPRRLKFEQAFELLNREALYAQLCGTVEIEDTERHPEFCEEADKAQEDAAQKLKALKVNPEQAERLRELINLIWEDAYKKTLHESKLFDVKYRKLQSEED